MIAVEPHPVRFRYLERNVRLNGLTNVTCIECALGAREGRLTLYDVDPTLGPRPLDASTRPGRGKQFDVALRRLDSLLADLGDPADISLVKIDVEGYELEVLRGMPGLLGRRPRLVVEVLGGEEALARVRDALPSHYRLREIEGQSYLAEPD